jgi:hypothetical protein
MLVTPLLIQNLAHQSHVCAWSDEGAVAGDGLADDQEYISRAVSTAGALCSSRMPLPAPKRSWNAVVCLQ